MTEKTDITWCDSTFNPWAGCTKVGPGCDNCYAEAKMDKRLHFVRWGPGEPRRRTSAKNWGDPVKWEREHAAFFAEHGRRRRVFCASLADVFDNEVPAQWREDLFDLIKATPHLNWLLLTKRIGNVARMLPNIGPDALGAAYPNVWLGITAVTQEEADRDIQKLLAIRAAVWFLSLEPLIERVDLSRVWVPNGILRNMVPALKKLDWIIVGGESGHQARPFDIEWPRDIVKQCQAAGVPVHVKQIGAQPRGWCAARVHATAEDDANCAPDYCDFYEAHEQGAPCQGRCGTLVDKAGADINEWPEDLRVRQWPQTT